MITCGVGTVVIAGVVVVAVVVVGMAKVTSSVVSTDCWEVLPSLDFEATDFILMAENRNN